MRIEQLEYLLEVAQCASISQASKNLFIGQSTLSTAISSLEEELQLEVFHRNHRGISTTVAGEAVIAEAKEIITHAQRLKNIAATKSNTPKNVHVTAYPAACITVMIAVANKTQQTFPEANLHVHETRPEGVVKGMLAVNGAIGLGALSSLRINQLKAEALAHGFICEVLYEERFGLYVRADHPLAEQRQISRADFSDERLAVMKPWITPSDNSFYGEFQDFKNLYSFNSFEAIKKAIVKNNMVSFSPKLSFYDDIYLDSGQIKEIEVPDFGEPLINFVVYPKRWMTLCPLELQILTEIKVFYEQLGH